MAVAVEDVRNIFREMGVRYQDVPEDEEWSASFWMPIEKYQFDEREGLNTKIILREKNDESSFELIKMLVGGVYASTDMSLLNQAHKRINQLNLSWKVVKWTCTTGRNSEGIPDWRVHIEIEIPLDGDGKLSGDQFWRSHSAIWHSIMGSWENFSIDLGLASSKQNVETIQEIPENIDEIDKETMMALFDRFLDEKFDNA